MVDGFQLLNEKIDSLKSDLKDDVREIKEIIQEHLRHCDKDMEAYEKRIRKLESYKNQIIGILIGVSAVAGFVSGLVILLLDMLWR